eukprot:g8538.t1
MFCAFFLSVFLPVVAWTETPSSAQTPDASSASTDAHSPSNNAKVSVGTIFEAWMAAYDHNRDILKERVGVKQKNESLTQALCEWHPRIQLEGTLSKGRDRASFEEAPGYVRKNRYKKTQGSAQISQSLFAGGGTHARTRAALLAFQASVHQLDYQTQSTFLQVAEVFLRLVSAQKLMEVYEKSKETMGKVRAQNKARYEVGDTSILDLKVAEAQLAQVEAELINAKAEWKAAHAQFVNLVGCEPGAFKSSQMDIPMPSGFKEAKQLAYANNPSWKAAQLQERVAGYGVNAEIAKLLPSIDLQLGASRGHTDYSRGSVDYMRRGSTTDAHALVSLRIPIDTGAQQSAVRSQELGLTDARIARIKAYEGLGEQITRYWTKYKAAKQALVHRETQQKSDKLAYQSALEEYKLGSRTFVDVSYLEDKARKSEADLIQARQEFTLSKLRVALLLGRLAPQNFPQMRGLKVYDPQEYAREWEGAWFGFGVDQQVPMTGGK